MFKNNLADIHKINEASIIRPYGIEHSDKKAITILVES